MVTDDDSTFLGPQLQEMVDFRDLLKASLEAAESQVPVKVVQKKRRKVSAAGGS